MKPKIIGELSVETGYEDLEDRPRANDRLKRIADLVLRRLPEDFKFLRRDLLCEIVTVDGCLGVRLVVQIAVPDSDYTYYPPADR